MTMIMITIIIIIIIITIIIVIITILKAHLKKCNLLTVAIIEKR